MVGACSCCGIEADREDCATAQRGLVRKIARPIEPCDPRSYAKGEF